MAALYEGFKWVREYLYYKAVTDAKTRAAAKAQLHASESNGGVATSQFDIQAQVEAKASELLRYTKPYMVHLMTLTIMAVMVTRLPLIDHVIQSIMHMLQVFISYMLMLAFMTYNVWIGLALVIGSGVGYFMFSGRIPKTMAVSKLSEHCH